MFSGGQSYELSLKIYLSDSCLASVGKHEAHGLETETDLGATAVGLQTQRAEGSSPSSLGGGSRGSHLAAPRRKDQVHHFSSLAQVQLRHKEKQNKTKQNLQLPKKPNEKTGMKEREL